MPRVTRAALRAASAADIHEEPDIAAHDNLTTVQEILSARPVLGEVKGNNTPTPEPATELDIAPISKGATTQTMAVKTFKKGKGGKKKNEKLQLTVQVKEDAAPAPEILEDENQSDVSSAAEAACDNLMRKVKSGEVHQVPMDSERPTTPPSAAARAASWQLSISPRKAEIGTPRFDPNIHSEEANTEGDNKEDSFVGSIHTRTPAKLTQDMPEEDKRGENEDSFVENIVSRSPSKPITRIEDSVEAIDALEEALEQVVQVLPHIGDDGLDSPVKTKAPPPPLQKPGKAAPPLTVGKKAPGVTATKVKPGSVKASTVKGSPVHVKTSKPRPVSTVVTTKETAAMSTSTSKPALSFSASPVKPATKSRPSSINLSTSKPGFIPARSTKPPTRSTFTLPGEAISAKMKAQREEKLKREAEAEVKRREFKARSVRTSIAGNVAVKPTAASRARESLMIGEKSKENIALNAGPERKSTSVIAVRTSSLNAGAASKRQSAVLSVAKRPVADGRPNATANSSALRAPVQGTGSSNRTSRVASGGGGIPASSKSTVTKAEAVLQKARAKEIFGRDKAEKEEQDRMRREKEEAARKARAEAAERGRIASREWAEKQRAKKMAGAASASAEPVAAGSPAGATS